jgi:hypothetical protein
LRSGASVAASRSACTWTLDSCVATGSSGRRPSWTIGLSAVTVALRTSGA